MLQNAFQAVLIHICIAVLCNNALYLCKIFSFLYSIITVSYNQVQRLRNSKKCKFNCEKLTKA